MKNLLFFLLISVMIIACKFNESKSPNLAYEDSSLSSKTQSINEYILDDEKENLPAGEKLESVNDAMIEPDKIMKEGNMVIEAEDLNLAKVLVDSIVKKHIGYYEKEVFKNSRYDQNYNLKIRVPSNHFDLAIKALESNVGVVLDKQINAKDVTEEYLDLEIRLSNNKAYLERYKKMLEKANSINEMIIIQEKIRQIEKQVDSNMGRMKYLSNRVAYSTLSLKLTLKPEEVIAIAPPTFFDDIGDAFQNGFSGLLFLIIVTANLWPIILGIILILLMRKRYLFMKKVNANS